MYPELGGRSPDLGNIAVARTADANYIVGNRGLRKEARVFVALDKLLWAVIGFSVIRISDNDGWYPSGTYT